MAEFNANAARVAPGQENFDEEDYAALDEVDAVSSSCLVVCGAESILRR